ncbi:Erythronate-4-phosphate dehydrogenase [hydrothermal vent metagenome]|uniref:Erythronate-4-phosphate dehydrogenase n=1 Tax=hydrothermal vent metagenome TaxID=652676 RepID=A0A3B0W0L8_9ZZZZ
MMKIVADENIPYVQSAFASLGEVTTLAGRNIKKADLIDCDILLVRSVTQVNQQLLAGTSIRFVASATSGINHIDLYYLKKHGIAFVHALGSNAASVAEYVMSAIAYWSLTTNKPLEQLSLGIIGCGQVGGRVKNLCHRFGIQTTLNDPPLAESDHQTTWSDLEDLLNCDVVTIHVPLTSTGKHATTNLINQQHIEQLKPGTLLINTARGEVVDEKALLARQIKHQDLSLVMDVWHNEPNINIKMLAHTLIGTPHIAGHSFDGKVRGTEMIYTACCDFFNQAKKWSATAVLSKVHATSTSRNQDISLSILKAYDIRQDNNRLKQLLNKSELTNGTSFDDLRKTYPTRREWSQTTL